MKTLRLSRHLTHEQLSRLGWPKRQDYVWLIGGDDPYFAGTDVRVTTKRGKFICHLLPGVIPTADRQGWFRESMLAARNPAANTKRVKNVGGGIHPMTKKGTPSVYPRPRRLKWLPYGREGTFGFEGTGRGGGCCPCAFNREFPEAFERIVGLSESLGAIAAAHEPKLWRHMLAFTEGRSHLTLNGGWSQGISNLQFSMTAHQDSGNFPGSMSAQMVFGDFEGGELIFPGYRLAVFMKPGDLLLFDGREHHGVGVWRGVRLSTVLYLKTALGNCE